MKQLFLLTVFSAVSFVCFAQHITNDNLRHLQKIEDSLKGYSVKLLQSTKAQERFNADSILTKMLVRALKTPNSFYYPFDSLETISKLYSPDSSFRIFTWQMVITDNVVRQHGAIQMRTTSGALLLYPLIDKSDVTLDIVDTVGDNKAWIGAVYYKIIQTKNHGQDFYTLLGYDENNRLSTRKIIEILNFSNDIPVFGGRYFSFEKDSSFTSAMSRYVMEFKKDASARLTYDTDMDMIVYEHLVSETGEPKKKWTYIPDGDYEGFKWQDGKWVHVVKVFNYKTPEGQEPVPAPLKNNTSLFEDKLEPNTTEGNKIEKHPVKKPKSAKQTKRINN